MNETQFKIGRLGMLIVRVAVMAILLLFAGSFLIDGMLPVATVYLALFFLLMDNTVDRYDDLFD